MEKHTPLDLSNNIIKLNLFAFYSIGPCTLSAHNNQIYNNRLGGFHISNAILVNISFNEIERNGYEAKNYGNGAILFSRCGRCFIYKNEIKFNRLYGVYFGKCNFVQIAYNDFIFNTRNAYFEDSFTVWYHNYWNLSNILKMIHGKRTIPLGLRLHVIQFDIDPAIRRNCRKNLLDV